MTGTIIGRSVRQPKYIIAQNAGHDIVLTKAAGFAQYKLRAEVNLYWKDVTDSWEANLSV